ICAINRIQCNCGAVYEAVDPKDRARDLNLFKCLVCGKEIISAKAYKVGDVHLIERPKPARDGNMAAPSVLFVLDRALKRGLRGSAVLTALGPGFTPSFLALEGAQRAGFGG